jgi:HEAT repeat protein
MDEDEAMARMFKEAETRRDDVIDSVVALGAEAVEPLILLLKSVLPDSRSISARALGRLGDERALPALQAAQEDSAENVRDVATEAIKAIRRQVR